MPSSTIRLLVPEANDEVRLLIERLGVISGGKLARSDIPCDSEVLLPSLVVSLVRRVWIPCHARLALQAVHCKVRTIDE